MKKEIKELYARNKNEYTFFKDILDLLDLSYSEVEEAYFWVFYVEIFVEKEADKD